MGRPSKLETKQNRERGRGDDQMSQRVTVRIPGPLFEYVEAQAEHGDFANESEVMRAALREHKYEHQDELEPEVED